MVGWADQVVISVDPIDRIRLAVAAAVAFEDSDAMGTLLVVL